MKKQELIEQIKGLKSVFGNKTKYIEKNTAIELVSRLDETQKVTIPQFVADWIEECEEKEKTLLNSLLYTPEGVNSWMGNSDNQELFARAWLDGYEVEEEPKYIVRLKNARFLYETLNFNKQLKQWYFSDSSESTSYRIKHTRKQLEEAGFGWVFDCEGIEVEEVEE